MHRLNLCELTAHSPRHVLQGAEYFDALEVLVATKDGSELSRSDQRLLKDVLNCGLSLMSTLERLRWRELASMCRRKQYSPARDLDSVPNFLLFASD